MRSDNPARGFSFLIADTPEPLPTRPTRQAKEELNLDFSDMGRPTDGDAQVPAPRQRTATLLDSAPPPLVRAIADALEEKSSPAPRDGLLSQRFAPAASGSAGRATALTAARPHPLPAAPAASPQGRDATPPTRKAPVSGHQARFSDTTRVHANQPTAAELVPAIKKISFPSRPKKVGPSPAPRTRFVEGGFRVRGIGESSPPPPIVAAPAASPGELAATITQPPITRATSARPTTTNSAGAPSDVSRTTTVSVAPSCQTEESGSTDIHGDPISFAVPEDLPQESQEPGGGSWGSDTPTAKELWIQARGGLFQAGQLARAASRRSWAKSRSAATVMSAALRQRLAPGDTDPEEASAGEPSLDIDGEALAALASRGQMGHTPIDGPEPRASSSPPRPTTAVARPAPGHPVRGPKPWARRTARSLAAPLAACAAALVVYQAGSHVLGPAGTSALSKGVPQVPDLGQLDPKTIASTNGADSAPTRDPSADRTPKTAGAPAMQVDQTKMPDGLSWPGKGLIEVVTAEDELIYVDGVFTGRGPLRRIPVTPGDHEISIKQNGSERAGAVSVELGRCARAVFAKAP